MTRFLSFSIPSLALISAVTYASGCSSSSGHSGPGGGDGGSSSDTPHAIGLVALGESHKPGGSSVPTVLATFLPDSTALPQACTTQVAGCTLVTAPQCGTGCGSGQVCGWDTVCNPTCQAACTAQCTANEECYFPSPGQPACRPTQSFDAGPLAFMGTTSPITMFPPYQYQGMAGGAPFLANAQIEIQAQGASGAGFDAFDEKLTATTFVQTTPPIDELASATVFGVGAVPIGWNPGSDTINITVTGAGGITVTCTAQDSTGHFDLPRAAIAAAQGSGGGGGFSITVTREHDDWYKSQGTRGTLTGQTVQPVGWLELTTESTESASFQGCPQANDTMCPDGCFDTSSDPLHCGSCTVVCTSDQSCNSGSCQSQMTMTDCTTCQGTADSGTCSSSYNACEADPNCQAYDSCTQSCGTGNPSCISGCQTQYPAGYSELMSYWDCICNTACTADCTATCSALSL
jgi:hypothetical protein